MANIQALLNLLTGSQTAALGQAAEPRALMPANPAAETFEQVLNRVNERAQTPREPVAMSFERRDVNPTRIREYVPADPSVAPPGKMSSKDKDRPVTEMILADRQETSDPDDTHLMLSGPPSDDPQEPLSNLEQLVSEAIDADSREISESALKTLATGSGLEKLIQFLTMLLNMNPEKAADLLVEASGGSVTSDQARAFLKAMQALLGKPMDVPLQTLVTPDASDGSKNPATWGPIQNNVDQNQPVMGPAPSDGEDKTPIENLRPVRTDTPNKVPDLSSGVPKPTNDMDDLVRMPALPTSDAVKDVQNTKTLRDLLSLLSESRVGRLILENVQENVQKPPVAEPMVQVVRIPAGTERANLQDPKPVLEASWTPPATPEVAPPIPTMIDRTILQEAGLRDISMDLLKSSPVASGAVNQGEEVVKSPENNQFLIDLLNQGPIEESSVKMPIPRREVLGTPKPDLASTADKLVPVENLDSFMKGPSRVETGTVPRETSNTNISAEKAVNENAAKNIPIVEAKGMARPERLAVQMEMPNPSNQNPGMKPVEASAVTAVVGNTDANTAGMENLDNQKAPYWGWNKTSTSPLVTISPVTGKATFMTSAPAPVVDPANLVEQITGQVQAHLLRGQTVSRLSFQLIPESLGRVTIQVVVVDQTVSARILVANPDVREGLQHHMVELKTALNQAGLQIDQLQVHVQGGSGQTLAQYYQYQQEGYASDLRGVAENVVETPLLEVPPEESPVKWGRMNLVDMLV